MRRELSSKDGGTDKAQRGEKEHRERGGRARKMKEEENRRDIWSLVLVPLLTTSSGLKLEKNYTVEPSLGRYNQSINQSVSQSVIS